MTRFLTPKRLLVWGAALCALSWFIHLQTTLTPGLVDRAGRIKGSDYVQFYVMGSLMNEGQADALYDAQAHLAEGRRRIHKDLTLFAAHPNYGPQVALAFVPLAFLPYLWSLLAFLALSAAAYAFSVWIVWRGSGALGPHGRVVAVLAAGSPLLLTVVRYGQASAFALLALSVALAAFRRKRLVLAGFAIGCLAYKPQLGVIFGIVFVLTREWRVVGGAAAAVAAQAVVAWMAAGSTAMVRYVSELWLLARHPSLVEAFPSELYSIRGFVHLLVPYEPVVAVCGIGAVVAAIVLGVRTWSSNGDVDVRFGTIVVLTILASPHLLSYDLLLLTVPLLVFANWAAQHADHRFRALISTALVLLYFAPFSGMIVARLTGVQVAVIVMAGLVWLMEREASAERQDNRAIVAPRCEAVSSQNSTTSGWRSSAA
jgi:alpha-1,2-mannosyltransferase